MIFKIIFALGLSFARLEEIAIYEWMTLDIYPVTTALIMLSASTISLIIMFGFADTFFYFFLRLIGLQSKNINLLYFGNGTTEARAKKLLTVAKRGDMVFFFLSLIPVIPYLVATCVVASRIAKSKYGFWAIWLGSSAKIVFLVFVIYKSGKTLTSFFQ